MMGILHIDNQILIIAIAVLAFFTGYIIRSVMGRFRKHSAEKLAQQIQEEAKSEAESKRKESRLEVREELYKARAEFEKEIQGRRLEISNLEKRVLQKEENFEKKSDLADRREMDFRNKEKALKAKEEELVGRQKELETVLETERFQLQKLSGLSREEAKRMLLSRLEEEIRQEAAYMIRQSQSRVHEEAVRKAEWIMSEAIQRCAVDHIQEAMVTIVSLPNEDIKGKIIGRDGRNIRTFETSTGVDLIVDDTPSTVVISAFDSVRREVARIALEQLIRDGRIHPARIEEVVEKVKKEMEETILQAGEQAVYEIGLTAVHPEIVKLVGRLKYRTSYGQNVLAHSKEVAWILGIISAELGMDVKLAKRIGLLHDIGKALSHEVEGSHALIGGDIARKYHEPEGVIAGIAQHHAETPETSVWGILSQVADAISAARPGARSDTVVSYVQRLEKLEALASTFPGVERVYAIQAGREIRVIVKPDEINDDVALLLSRDIAKKIQGDLQYPGMIKVTVIRETRAVEYAR